MGRGRRESVRVHGKGVSPPRGSLLTNLFTTLISGLGSQDPSSPSRAASQRPWLLAITRQRQVLRNFQNTLARKLIVAETLIPQTRKAPRARGLGPICYMAFSFLHLFHGPSGIGGWGQDAKSYPLITYIHSMSYWPLEGAFWVDLLPATHGEGQLEASLNPEELNAVPWWYRPGAGRWLLPKKSWWLSGPQKAPSTGEKQVIKKDNKINKSAFWVHINISLIS